MSIRFHPRSIDALQVFDRFGMAVWLILLDVSLAVLPLNGSTGIDVTGFERAYTSRFQILPSNQRRISGWLASAVRKRTSDTPP